MGNVRDDSIIPVRTAGARRRALLCLAALLPPMALASCAPPKGVEVQPPVTMPKSFSATGRAALPREWWTTFGDDRLNALMNQALRDNFSLRVAWDRLDQARALAERSGAERWPGLDGTAGVSRTVTKAQHSRRAYATEYSLGVVASYEVDLWGRIRSTHDAARLDVYATNEDLHAAAITLTAQVARTWYRLIEQRGQVKLLNEQIKTDEDYLEVITLKFRRGQASATDVLQQRQLVESAKGERVLVESDAQVLEHELAVLLGRAPGSISPTAPQLLPELPPLPRTGVPAAWLRMRPDVRAAELRVQAADRRVAAAIADQFPRLSISAGAGTSAERTHDLFDNWLASIAANLVAPLFDGGARRAEVERTRAAVSQQLNSYGAVVLTSLKEVEDALAREARQGQYLQSLRKQLELSRQSTDQTRDSYMKGTMDFTRYLTTLLSHQRLQRTYLQAQRQLVDFRIDLHRALGGSLRLPRPPRAKVAGKRGPVAYTEDDAQGRRDEPQSPKRQ